MSSPLESASLGQRIWRRVCLLLVRTFYRQFEVEGLEYLPAEGPVILCANHVNALVDALVVQAACPRPIHPIARSGLFRNPLLRPILAFIQAVPIYRRPQDEAKASRHDASNNDDSFRRCFEILAGSGVLLIFPEGQSHSDPSLRPLKTGAARLALGHRDRAGEVATVVPVGLNFTRKGRFRAGVLVKLAPPVGWQVDAPVAGTSLDPAASEEQVRRYTAAIDAGLKRVTLNIESWEDLQLMRLLQQFFALRLSLRRDDGGFEPLGENPNLSRRFRSFQRIQEAQQALRDRWPERVEALRQKLRRFDQLCRRYGVRDYQLRLQYTPRLLFVWWLRTFAFVACIVPIALWGLVNSGLPFLLTRTASRLSARGRDQYDTAGMLWGLLFFLGFWGLQSAGVFLRWGGGWAAAYAASLPFASLVALKLGFERRRIWEEMRVFLLFLRRRRLQFFLREKREELEVEVDTLARLARQAEEPTALLDDA